MKQIILLFTLLIFSFSLSAQAGAKQFSSTERANLIANKLRDSLFLSKAEFIKVTKINEQIETQMNSVFSKYNSRDSISFHLHAIEGSRDSLYKIVLPGVKFEQYIKKKQQLLLIK